MKIICHGCGKSFEGDGEKFCNNVCRDFHIEKLENVVKEATEKDPNHTKKLSETQ